MQRIFGHASPIEPPPNDIPAVEPVLPDTAMAMPSRAPGRPESIIQSALAQKTLHGWMQNRYQTRYPLVLNLAHLPPDHGALLLETVRRAVQMIDSDKATLLRAASFIESIGGQLIAAGPATGELVETLREARLLPQAYAACAGAIGRTTTANRRFLDFLAARFDLPDDMARSINRRFAI